MRRSTFLYRLGDDFLVSMLPDGFVERTKGRGLIISWAPQLDVLSPPSIGGFLTHCGWNSITENLSTACVAMLCWSQIVEQRLNARILVDEWRVALDMTMEYDSLVKATDILQAVCKLMQGDIGEEIKNRTLGLRYIYLISLYLEYLLVCRGSKQRERERERENTMHEYILSNVW